MSEPFSVTRRVQFAETDMAGVLHFSNYFRYMEEVEHEFWRSLGRSVVIPEGLHTMSWPRVAVSCEYFSPARFEDQVTLAFQLTHIGDRSLSYEVEFLRDGQLIASGKTTAVCCGMKEGRFTTMDIPDELRAKLKTHLITDLPKPNSMAH